MNKTKGRFNANAAFKKMERVAPYLLCAVFYAWVAFQIGLTDAYTSAPDEGMRALLPQAISSGNLFPSGYDAEVIYGSGYWSYAFYPQMLGAYVAAVFMFLAKVLQLGSNLVIIFGRFASICFSLITLRYFSKTLSVLVKTAGFSQATQAVIPSLGVLVLGFWPQYAYLSSYINNDIVALCGVSIMIYACFSHVETGWNYKGAVCLGVGIVVAALGYWNAYPFILAAIIIFLVSISRQNKFEANSNKFKIIALAVFVSAIGTFPFFILNIVRYGDLTGMTTFHLRYEQWLAEGGSVLQTPYAQGMVNLLLASSWVYETLVSFVGTLGYLKIQMPFLIVLAYFAAVVFFIGAAALRAHGNGKCFGNKLVWMALLLASMLTCFLSVYYSTRTDWQPQGRYIIYLLIPLLLGATLGIASFLNQGQGLAKDDSGRYFGNTPCSLKVYLFGILYCSICVYFFVSSALAYCWNGPGLQ